MNVILHVHITIVTVVGSHSYILSNICLYEKLDGAWGRGYFKFPEVDKIVI